MGVGKALAGGHMHNLTKVAELLAEKGLDHALAICAGIIPDDDIPDLKRRGRHQGYRQFHRGKCIHRHSQRTF